MCPMYSEIVFVLLCVHQRFDLETISEQLGIELDRLGKLLDNLVKWGLVEVGEKSVSYYLSNAGENIIKYTKRDQEKGDNLT